MPRRVRVGVDVIMECSLLNEKLYKLIGRREIATLVILSRLSSAIVPSPPRCNCSNFCRSPRGERVRVRGDLKDSVLYLVPRLLPGNAMPCRLMPAEKGLGGRASGAVCSRAGALEQVSPG